MSNEIETVLEAVAPEIEGLAALTTLGAIKTKIRGREPRAVNPSECPATAVFWPGDQQGTYMSGQINVPLIIEARYYRESVKESETLIVNKGEAYAMTRAADAIFNHWLTKWRAGGLVGAWQIRPVAGSRQYRRFGLVEGIAVQAVVDIFYSG